MGTPAELEQVRLLENLAPPARPITNEESKTQKIDYAAVVANPAKLKGVRLGDPNVKARVSTHNGIPTVIFKASDYYGVMAEECMYTIIGKFLRTRPNIERIRLTFAEKVSLKGEAKIGVYDFRTVFIDVTNEEDCKTVWFRRSIEIDGMVMWLQKWSPDFKPEEDSPIVPVWVLLSGLPFHCHTWYYVKKILAPVGVPLSMDLATDYRTRPGMAKVRVEIDLTKHLVNSAKEDINAQPYNSKEEHSANHSATKEHIADQSQEIVESSSTDIDKGRHTVAERRTTSSKNKEYESEQDEMNERRYEYVQDSQKTEKKEHNRHQYPSSSIDTEIRNQPPIKLVLELFEDDQDKDVTHRDQNNQVCGIEQQQTNSTSSNINEDKKRGSHEESQEIARVEENLCPEDGKGKNKQRRTGKKS
ncbi:hypothetical protein A4A49_20107 [Nicotiana attenuata]|uniref:DUF4283 domain-containing protein n=1 Tax=Nicotiana attenuata TaxID=49451 RepID=A0A1J6IEV3_NICAT|nr:hypothetical protein A4A49_20107 [Nicotiana attenuata]